MLRTQESGDEDYIANALVLASAFTVLVTPHFPWYYCLVNSFPVFRDVSARLLSFGLYLFPLSNLALLVRRASF